MEKEIKNEENLPKYTIPKNPHDSRNLPLPQPFFTPDQLTAMLHHFQIKPEGMRFPNENWDYQQDYFKNEHLIELKSPKNNIKANYANSSEKIKKKIKKKKEKIDVMKQINPNKMANLKKTNLKNTYINKIHHLMNEDEKSNCFKDSNSDSESEHNHMEHFMNPNDEMIKKTKSMMNFSQGISKVQSCQSTMKDLEDVTNRNSVKLEKNRESARNSRKRKKVYIMLLENKVSELTKEITNLKKELEDKTSTMKMKFSSKTMDSFMSEKQYLLEKIENLLKQNVDSSEINLLLDSFTFRYGSNGKERFIAINYFIKQLINVLIPNHMKFLLSITNDMDFLNSKKKLKFSEKNNSNLDLNLQSLIDLGEEQKQMFFKQQKKLLLEKQYYDQIIYNMHNLKKLMFKANDNLQGIFDDTRNILTPNQTAKFIFTLEKEKDLNLYPDTMWTQLCQIDFDDVSGRMEKLEEVDDRDRNKPESINNLNKRSFNMSDGMPNYPYPNIMDFIYNTQNEFPHFNMMGSNLDLKDQKEIDMTMYLFKEFNENLNKK